MNIFITSIIVVSLIGLCFFKKSFWENRYLLLMIIGVVALVATTTTNYIVRGKYDIIAELIKEKQLKQYHVPDSLLTDGIPFQTNEEFSWSDFNHADSTTVDSIETETLKHSIVFYDMHKDEPYWKIGFIVNNNETYEYWEDVYIMQSPNDSLVYFSKLKLVYDFSNASNWISKHSIPRRKTIKCLYIPKAEYEMIPDSLIRELPIKI